MANFQKAYTQQVGTHILEPGVEFGLLNKKEKLRYIATVTNLDNGEVWVDCFDVKRSQSRAVYPEAINPRSIKKPRKPKEDT